MSVFITQNKTRPGVYMNFESMSENLTSVSERGITLLPLELDFLASNEPIYVDVYTNFLSEYGISLNDPCILPVREALKNAETVIIYRLNSGEKSTITGGEITATAKHTGAHGNNISFSVTHSAEDTFDVLTYVNNTLLEQFNVKNLDEISSVVLDFSGALCSVDKISLAGGSSANALYDDYANFFDSITALDFNTFALPVTDNMVKALAQKYTENMRNMQGKKIQFVVSNYPNADFEGVISVANGVILQDGTEISPEIAACYVAGAVAGCSINQSLTYSTYSGACDVTSKYSNTEICEKLENGEFLFTTKRDKVVIEQDINTFTSYSPTKSNIFSKNRVIRVIDNISTDVKTLFEDYYLGKVSNNAQGRSLFTAECINYMRTLENIDCIENFDPSTDISVESGENSDSIVVNLNIKPIDSIEKLYMTVTLS
ncbi:MAG: phage tail sheath family protein [Clostridia bacterium]